MHATYGGVACRSTCVGSDATAASSTAAIVSIFTELDVKAMVQSDGRGARQYYS